MFRRTLAFAVLAIVIAACGSAATNPPSDTQPPGATATPAETQGGGETTPPNAGDLEATARALVPPGSTETGKFEVGGFFQLYLTSTTSMQDLETFWDQKLAALGINVVGKFTAEGTLTYSFTNPDGGIVASPDTSGGSDTVVVIAVGTSS